MPGVPKLTIFSEYGGLFSRDEDQIRQEALRCGSKVADARCFSKKCEGLCGLIAA